MPFEEVRVNLEFTILGTFSLLALGKFSDEEPDDWDRERF